MKNKLFTTQEFADLCNVSKHTLFYYDKEDIFKPYYVNEKGYRFYSIYQYDTFLTILDLRKHNMSISSIKAYLDTKSPVNLLKLYDEEITKINQDIRFLQNLKKNILISKDEVSNAYHHKNEFIYEDLEKEYIIVSAKPIARTYEGYNEVFRANSNVEIESIFGLRISKDDVLINEVNQKVEYYIRPLNKCKQAIIKEAGTYLVYYYEGLQEEIIKGYQKLVEYLDLHKIEGDSYFYEEQIIGDWCVSDPNNYIFKLSIRINK